MAAMHATAAAAATAAPSRRVGDPDQHRKDEADDGPREREDDGEPKPDLGACLSLRGNTPSPWAITAEAKMQ